MPKLGRFTTLDFNMDGGVFFTMQESLRMTVVIKIRNIYRALVPVPFFELYTAVKNEAEDVRIQKVGLHNTIFQAK